MRFDTSKTYTYGDILGPAMKITDHDEADAYFWDYVEYVVSTKGTTQSEAVKICRSNLGYYAGYYDHETCVRVERLFSCCHPVFGTASNPVSPEEAFRLGLETGERG